MLFTIFIVIMPFVISVVYIVTNFFSISDFIRYFEALMNVRFTGNEDDIWPQEFKDVMNMLCADVHGQIVRAQTRHVRKSHDSEDEDDSP